MLIIFIYSHFTQHPYHPCLLTFSNLSTLLFISTGSGNICTVCEKDCKTPHYLQLHMNTKHEAAKFMCQQCNRSFKWKQSFRKHMATHHDDSCKPVMYSLFFVHTFFSLYCSYRLVCCFDKREILKYLMKL